MKGSKVINQESVDDWRKIKKDIYIQHQRPSLNRDRGCHFPNTYHSCRLANTKLHKKGSKWTQVLCCNCFRFIPAISPFFKKVSQKVFTAQVGQSENYSQVCPWEEIVTHTLNHLQSNPFCPTALLLDLFTLDGSGATVRPSRPHRWAPAVEAITTLSAGLIKCRQQQTGHSHRVTESQREIGTPRPVSGFSPLISRSHVSRICCRAVQPSWLEGCVHLGTASLMGAVSGSGSKHSRYKIKTWMD